MLTKRKAIMKIIWVVINFILFMLVSGVIILHIMTDSKVGVFATLGIAGTGYTCISGLLDIWVAFPDYMRALKGLNKC